MHFIARRAFNKSIDISDRAVIEFSRRLIFSSRPESRERFPDNDKATRTLIIVLSDMLRVLHGNCIKPFHRDVIISLIELYVFMPRAILFAIIEKPRRRISDELAYQSAHAKPYKTVCVSEVIVGSCSYNLETCFQNLFPRELRIKYTVLATRDEP